MKNRTIGSFGNPELHLDDLLKNEVERIRDIGHGQATIDDLKILLLILIDLIADDNFLSLD